MKNKIMSLLTILCITLSSIAFGQYSFGDNVVKRNSCTASNCSTLPVYLTLTSPLWSLAVSHTIYCPDAGQSYGTGFTKIKVSVSGHSSTGDYSLPTSIGSSTLIPPTDLDFGTYGYGVTITKTGEKQFTLYMARFEHPTP